jgi:RNA polymerase sigma-70 factor (ECF subfamily)
VNVSEHRGSHASDARLVASAKRGDAEAFALLYRRYLDRVYDFVAVRLEGVEAAQDATQTIFLRALSALHQCRDEEHFAGWLFAIARNVVIDTYRSPRQVLVEFDAILEIEDRAESPESLVMRSEEIHALREARDRCLSGVERELLDLRLQDLTSQEIAVAMKRSQTAIRNVQYRMIKKLRDCLGIGATQGEETHVVA